MPTQDSVVEIAGYIQSFEEGTRAHDQSRYHAECGTAHCLAGWKEYDDAIAQGIEVTWRGLQHDYSDDLVKMHPCEATPGRYAAVQWGLSTDEADELFWPTLTLGQMKKNLRAIAKSHGLTCPL